MNDTVIQTLDTSVESSRRGKAVVKPKASPRWSKARNGLRQYLYPGPNQNIWYIHCRVNGHSITEPTGTSAYSIAVKKKTERLNELNKTILQGKKGPSEKLSLGDCLEIADGRLGGSDNAANTLEVKRHRLATLYLTWSKVPKLIEAGVADLKTVSPKDVSFDHILFWKTQFLKPEAQGGFGYSGDYFNKTFSWLRIAFDIAIEKSLVFVSPCPRVEAASIDPSEKVIPTTEEFERALTCPLISKECRDFLNGLRYTGLRKEEANLLRVRHVVLEKGKEVLNLPASICKGRRHGRTVPIFPEALPLFTRLVKEADNDPDALVFKILDAKKGIATATKWAGLKHLSHHSLRHYFATRCLEQTKDVTVVAAWLGHVDNGQLALKTYTHACDKFANEAAKRVRFSASSEDTARLVFEKDTTVEAVIDAAADFFTPAQLLKLSKLAAACAEGSNAEASNDVLQWTG